MQRRDFGDILVRGKVISAVQLADARKIQETTGADLGEIMLERSMCKPEHILKAKGHLWKMKVIDLEKTDIDPSAVNVVPDHVAQRHNVMPIRRVNDQLYVATADGDNLLAMDDIKMACQLKVEPVLATPEAIEAKLSEFYAGAADNGASNGANDDTESESIASLINEYTPEGGLETDGGDADMAEEVQGPIIRMAKTIVQQAILGDASDIHLEPSAGNTRIRYRVDGVLREVMQVPRHIHPPLISRFKIMAEMNIAERRVPQDGRIGIVFQEKDYDLRVSCLPTLFGEKIVMRILDKTSVMLGLNKLGFFPDTLSLLEELIHQPNGLLLSTGPTGSGKTTTQYSVLNRINSVEKNIMTVEDPVEYQLPGVSQVAVHNKAGLSFSTALRSFMRQDPDIIMVGEIRDLETAELAIQASLTGHLVLSTIHTNDAPSTVSRLVDIGVEPFLVSATLIGALAQRLARRVCEKCKVEYETEAGVLASLGYRPEDPEEIIKLVKGTGCERCNDTGYKGRIGIYEMMTINEEIAEMMVRRTSLTELRNAAIANGMKTLQDDGLRKVLAGITTPDEVQRVVFTAGH